MGRVEQVAAVAEARVERDLRDPGQRLPRPLGPAAAARPSLVVIAGQHQRPRALGEARDQGALGGARVLELVDDQVREALGDRRRQRRALPEQPGQGQHGAAAVEGARLAQHGVVHLVDLGELALALGGVELGAIAAGQGLGPLAEPLGAHRGSLERVDSPHDPGQQPGGVAADLVTAQRQLVAAVEQHRQALGGGEALDERVQAGLGGVLGQQPHSAGAVRVDQQLLVARSGGGLRALAQARGRRLGGGQGQRPLPLARQGRQAAGERLGAPGPGQPLHQQRALGVGHHALLGIGQIQGRVIGLLGHRNQASSWTTRPG